MRWNLLFLLSIVDAKKIINGNLNSCKNCIHYTVDAFSNYDSMFNKCGYFGTKNLQTDRIEYKLASSCRENEDMCGLEGKYFQQSKYVQYKTLLYSLKEPGNIVIIYFIIYISILIHYSEK